MSVKERLLAGKKVFGTMLRVERNPAVCFLAKNAGLDFVMFDCEHSNYTMETLHDMFITGKALGLESFLRVPGVGRDYVSRALDQGATGVMLPLLESAEMAQKLVDHSKYIPLGKRGYTGGIAYSGYVTRKHTASMEIENATVVSIAQIETATAVDHADEIAAVPGLDALLIGPNDLSISLGIPGDLTNPIELDAIKTVIAACKRHNKLFGLHSGPALLKMFYDDLNIVMMKTDIDFLSEGFKSVRAQFE